MDAKIEAMLEESGRAWSIEQRKRHKVLLIEGRAVLFIPNGKGIGGKCAGRQLENSRAAVKRHLRALTVR